MLYFTADWHLTDRMWVGEPRLDGDSYVMLNRLVDAVIADETDQPKYLIIAGDITDNRAIEGRVLNELTSAMQRLFDAGVGVLFIQGNHDRGVVHHLSVCGGIQMENSEVYEIDGYRIAGISYMARTKLQEAVAACPGVDILVLHCAMQHMLGFEGAYDLSVADIPRGIVNVVVGDVHKRELLAMRDRPGWCLSPGSLQACDIGQGDDHGLWRLAPKDTKTWPVYIPLKHRKIVRIMFDVAEDLKELQHTFESLAEAHAEELALVEVSYDPDRAEEVTALLAMYRAKLILRDFEQRLASQAERQAADSKALYQRVTLRAALDMRLRPEEDPAVYDLLSQVLDRPIDARAIVEAFREGRSFDGVAAEIRNAV